MFRQDFPFRESHTTESTTECLNESEGCLQCDSFQEGRISLLLQVSYRSKLFLSQFWRNHGAAMRCCFQERKLSQFYSSEKTPLNNRKRALYCLCAMGSPQFMSERFLVLNVCNLLTSSKCSGSGRANAEIGNWKNFFTAGCAELAHQLKYVNRTRRE